MALPEHDRYLRFGYAASDAQIARYADAIDFAQDEVFGVFNRRLELIALAHLAGLKDAHEAEFGVSVLPKARARGYGARLFDHAVLHARNRGVDTLLIHALSENSAMLRIARNAGASVERDGGETLARLRLPRDDLRSHLDAFIESSAAEVDYRLKAQSRKHGD
jgi:GNAT superfamily N-acetyltransferase